VRAIRLGCGVVACAALLRLGVALWRRTLAGQAPRGPELGVLATGLLLFHPYLWFPDTMGATFAMLAPHYVQYLGLLWLLHRRKFPVAAGSTAQRVLCRLSANTVLLCVVLLAASLPFLLGRGAMGRLGWSYQFSMLYILLALLHFYLDSLFWAFKQPHVRATIAPYLRPARS